MKQFTNATSNRVFKCSYQDTHVMVRVHGEGREGERGGEGDREEDRGRGGEGE